MKKSKRHSLDKSTAGLAAFSAFTGIKPCWVGRKGSTVWADYDYNLRMLSIEFSDTTNCAYSLLNYEDDGETRSEGDHQSHESMKAILDEMIKQSVKSTNKGA